MAKIIKQSDLEIPNVLINLARNVLMYRAQAKMTQEELAKKVKCNPSMIAQIETGRRIPSLILAVDIAKALDTTVSDLLEERK